LSRHARLKFPLAGMAPITRGGTARRDMRSPAADEAVTGSAMAKNRPRTRPKIRTKTRPKRTAAGQEMTTADAAVAALAAHGIDTIYALPGVHNDDFFDALARNSDTIRTVHPRHEQGAAYMALGAALATGAAQAYCVVPGPGLLNSSAALLTAYGMNAPVLAIVGQIPQAAIGKGFGHLHEIGDQAGIIARLVDWSAHIRTPNDAPRLIAKAMQSMFVERPGPAALECAIDVWGRSGPVQPVAPLPLRAPPIDEDALKAAAKRLGAAKRPLIVAGGGALDAAAEVTQLAHLLQAPVLSYRRGRGVLSDRDPLSVNLPLGHELWAEADVVLGIGTHLHMPLLQWGFDRDLAVISIDLDPEAPARIAKPKVALIGNARPILQRLLDLLPTYNTRRPSRTDEMRERHDGVRKRLAKLAPQLAYLSAIRAELPEDGIFVDEVTQLGFAARLSGVSAAHLPVARLSGQSGLRLCHRARCAGRPAQRAGVVDHRRRRFHVHGNRNGDRGAPSHSAGHGAVQRRRLRQRPPHPRGAFRPADRERPRQPGFRQVRGKLRRHGHACNEPSTTGSSPTPRFRTP
jgi:acetolactate synthase-1/2/3 large subunit